MLTKLITGNTFKKAPWIIFGVCAGCDRSSTPNSFAFKRSTYRQNKALRGSDTIRNEFCAYRPKPYISKWSESYFEHYYHVNNT